MLPGADASSLWRKFQVSQQLRRTLTSPPATHLILPTIPRGRAVVTTISIFTDELRPGEMKQLTQDQMVTPQPQRRSAWLQTRALTISLAGLLLGFPEPIVSVFRAEGTPECEQVFKIPVRLSPASSARWKQIHPNTCGEATGHILCWTQTRWSFLPAKWYCMGRGHSRWPQSVPHVGCHTPLPLSASMPFLQAQKGNFESWHFEEGAEIEGPTEVGKKELRPQLRAQHMGCGVTLRLGLLQTKSAVIGEQSIPQSRSSCVTPGKP